MSLAITFLILGLILNGIEGILINLKYDEKTIRLVKMSAILCYVLALFFVVS